MTIYLILLRLQNGVLLAPLEVFYLEIFDKISFSLFVDHSQIFSNSILGHGPRKADVKPFILMNIEAGYQLFSLIDDLNVFYTYYLKLIVCNLIH